MKFSNRIWIMVVFFSIIGFSSCTKETNTTFIVPSTYRFNSPVLDAKYVYAIDPTTKNAKIIVDSLGSFNRSNSEISDSINFYVQQLYLTKSLRSITFKDQNTATLEFAKLDTSMSKNTFVNIEMMDSRYALSGNNIVFDGFPQYNFTLDNSFLEINWCLEFSLRNQKKTNGENLKSYFTGNCANAEPTAVVNNIVKLNPSIVYDTISLELVHLIFSKY